MTIQSIVLGGGCFWGVEDAFRRVKGVTETTVGYAGGSKANPSYAQVCTGTTGHAEVVEVKFDDEKISLHELLDVFWKVHNPTQLNRQGPDRGTQYRSIILYSPGQEEAVVASFDELRASGVKAVTEIRPLEEFFEAEEYHQDYLEKNPGGYCHIPQSLLSSIGERQKV